MSARTPSRSVPLGSVRAPRGTTALDFDPLAAISARGFLIVVATVCLVSAVALTVTTAAQTSSWPLAIGALVALAAGFGWFIRSAFDFTVGVSTDRFATVFALLAVATVLNSLGSLGSNLLVRDDWGLLTLALALMAAAPFRTAAELGLYTGISTALVTVLSLLHVFFSPLTPVPIAVIVLVAVAPVLALGLGAMGYARVLLAGIYAERLAQAEARDRQFDAQRQRFIDDDGVGSIGPLREEVVPFLARLRMAGELTVDDRLRAAELTARLQAAVDGSRPADSLGDQVDVFIDEAELSLRMHEDDRATIRAVLRELNQSPRRTPGTLVLELLEGEEDRFGIIRCSSADVRSLRAEVLPFIRMMRLMMSTASDEVAGDELLLHFDLQRLAS
ncbi:hypothetical protein NVV95_04310 [Herbiconiux sp. CPCC 205716]|uniref:Uncharacterized protein n=1 Tax=Herbiconiux gentiana TaxID=2970912 RepID=A0ABT2GC41_9MICO|nr:hypothetical protein [Herbiconiux gentiana]MCS5713773.1 hypothetical protein [Herbiconiux gentiana]